jgi:DNA-binding transcriptional ArsR family regulator
MKLSDLPGRVIRPLGEWHEFEPVPYDPKAPVRSEVLTLLRAGVCKPTEIAERIGKSHYSVTQALRALQAKGLAEQTQAQRFTGAGSDSSE